MYLVVIAWLYVALMMSVAEATNANGSVLGAVITFVLYGVGPVALVVYLMGWPRRSKLRKARERQAWEEYQQRHAQPQEAASGQPDAGGQAPADPVAPVREKP